MRASDSKGFTLVELITTMVIIAILATVTAGIVVTLMQLLVYMPRDVNTRMVAESIAGQVLEGSPGARGIGYAVSINDAQDDRITYTVGYPSSSDQYTVTFTYNAGTDKVYMQIGSGSSSIIPYNAANNISVTCPSNVFFTYYKKDGTSWSAGGTDTYNIGRVEIAFTVVTGSGLFTQAQGSFTTTSGTDVKQYI
ncbi:MAG: prepilin-type N-terminal cleavage/methylation domain-containing protein [Candidatus Omnitrophica bacterium]|nr:prepilin-type N-terminal cleavage/methylation domain-containing protein [Candidatus Omnitrophota bacterium]MDD5436678.1 prepilin-type N-terminal cleavage/methylation domain-containing protein [Candidatus Omnitrophota bacterium]